MDLAWLGLAWLGLAEHNLGVGSSMENVPKKPERSATEALAVWNADPGYEDLCRSAEFGFHFPLFRSQSSELRTPTTRRSELANSEASSSELRPPKLRAPSFELRGFGLRSFELRSFDLRSFELRSCEIKRKNKGAPPRSATQHLNRGLALSTYFASRGFLRICRDQKKMDFAISRWIKKMAWSACF